MLGSHRDDNAATSPADPELALANFMSAAAAHRDQTLLAWAEGWDRYARYLDALTKARDPQAWIAVQTAFVTQALDALADGAAKMQRNAEAGAPK